jgi:hypothetical protein
MSPRFSCRASLKPFAPPWNSIVRGLDVSVEEPTRGTIALRYVLEADLSRLRIPATRASRHRDELWKHTCFEMFVRRAPNAPPYYELNASPSTEWALYSFERYGEKLKAVNPARPPQIGVTLDPKRLQLDVKVDLRDLPHAGEMGLAAVIEDTDGELSYWALKHVGPKANFHHPDSFILKR